MTSTTLGPVPLRSLLLVGGSAVLWGLYWIPIKVLNSFGVTGVWGAIFLGVAGVMASLPLIKLSQFDELDRRHLVGALGVGCAFTLYAAAITYTEVIRVILLFYLAPAWSTLIECLFFGRRWSLRSLIGLLLSFGGIVVIFRGELPVDGLGALGDWMAVGAGLAWSTGAALVFSGKTVSSANLTFASMLASVIVAFACLLLIGSEVDSVQLDSATEWTMVILATGLFGVLYLLPVVFISMWGAASIPPATMSFILTLEIVSAVASSSLFLNEQFGWVELLGTLLIIGGALTEVLRLQRQRPLSI